MPTLASPAPNVAGTVAEGAATRVFHTLDALRGIAAIGVVIFHMQPLFAPIVVPGGYLAVDLFFIMSGVVLSRAYERRFQAGMGTIEFMRVRLIRLYPLYLLGLLAGIAVTLLSMYGRNSQNWDMATLLQAAVWAVLFLPNLSGRTSDQLFPLNIPCWSLFLELIVNLLFVLTWPFLQMRRLLIAIVVSGVVVCVATMQQGNVDLGYAWSSLIPGLARTVFGFCIGIVIARGLGDRRPASGNLKVLGIIVLFAVAVCARPEGAARVAWDCACVLVVFPVLVWMGVRVDPGSMLRRVATFLGLTSYAVYVLHSPISAVVNSISQGNLNLGVPISPWLGLITLVLLLISCWFVDRVYDTPVRRMLGRCLSWGRPALRT